FDVSVVDLTASPQDVNGLSLVAASGLDDIKNTFLVDRLATGHQASYVLVSGLFALPTPIDPGLHGQAGGLVAGEDYTAVVLANRILQDNSGTPAEALAYTIAHEAAHTFGVLHTENARSASQDSRMLTQSDRESQYYDNYFTAGAAQLANLNMFTRFPLPLA